MTAADPYQLISACFRSLSEASDLLDASPELVSARTGLGEKIIRSFGNPFLIELCSAARLQIADECAETGIICARKYFFRDRLRERGNLAGGTTKPMIGHCTG